MTISTTNKSNPGQKRQNLTPSPSMEVNSINIASFDTQKNILPKNNDPVFMERINSLLGESTIDTVNNTIGNPSHTRSQKQSSRLMKIIKRTIQKPSQQMSPLSLKFERSTAAALHNSELILKHNGILQDLFDSMDPSVIHYGSEFCPKEDLEELLSQNNKWEKFSKIITNGVDYPIDPLPENE